MFGVSDALRSNSAVQWVSRAIRHPCEDKWFFVGSISDFQPGAEIEVESEGGLLKVSADEWGVSVRGAAGKKLALRIAVGGQIFVSPKSHWEENYVLSHSTGEPLKVDF